MEAPEKLVSGPWVVFFLSNYGRCIHLEKFGYSTKKNISLHVILWRIIWQRHMAFFFFFFDSDVIQQTTSKLNWPVQKISFKVFENWKCAVTPTFICVWFLFLCLCAQNQKVHGFTGFLPAYTCRTIKSPICVCQSCGHLLLASSAVSVCYVRICDCIKYVLYSVL